MILLLNPCNFIGLLGKQVNDIMTQANDTKVETQVYAGKS